jgi:hypothetical protein
VLCWTNCQMQSVSVTIFPSYLPIKKAHYFCWMKLGLTTQTLGMVQSIASVLCWEAPCSRHCTCYVWEQAWWNIPVFGQVQHFFITSFLHFQTLWVTCACKVLHVATPTEKLVSTEVWSIIVPKWVCSCNVTSAALCVQSVQTALH